MKYAVAKQPVGLEMNIDTFSKIKFNRIVTQCPHCFNTLKNEYPQMGGSYRVQHYTEYLAEMMPSWKSMFPIDNSLTDRLAYHDSCYLGRYNDIYDQPRKLLEFSRVTKVELPRNGENSFCCGGGGGHMWMETDAETRINHRRLQEALDENVSLVATACPYCLLMFDDAIRSKGIGDKIQALDLVEVLENQMS
jgi:Fe-S oxidoreductase